MTMQTHRTAPMQCPACHKQQDAYTGPREAHPGDVVVCAYCATANRFDARMQLETMTRRDLERMADEAPELARNVALAQAAVFAYRAVDQVRRISKGRAS